MELVMAFLYRLLIGCLLVWLIDKTLTVFGVKESIRDVVMVIAVILAWAFALFGWAIKV